MLRKSSRFNPNKVSASLAVWAGAAGCVLGVAMGTIYAAPASWLAAGVDATTAGHVRLVNPQGRIWAGSAALTLASSSGGIDSFTLPSRISWDISPALTGATIELRAACCNAIPIKAKISPTKAWIETANLSMPIALLQGLGSPWNTFGLAGRLQLRVSGLEVSWIQGEQRMHGQIEAEAQGVSTKLSTLPEVGTYRLVLTGGDSPKLNLTTMQGELNLQGQGNWQAGKFKFIGEGQAKPNSASALANLLTLLGERRQDKTVIKF